MKKKLIGWLLTGIGFIFVAVYVLIRIIAELDISIKIDNPFLYDLMSNHGVEVILGTFGLGLLLMVIGLFILGMQRIFTQADKAVQNLPPDEVLIHRQEAKNSIVLVTTKRVFYFGIFTKNLKYSTANIPASDKEIYNLSDIANVRAVAVSDAGNNPLAKRNKAQFGIQLTLKNQTIINIPASEGELLASVIQSKL